MYINTKIRSIKPLTITYTGMLKSKKTNIPLLNTSMQNTLQDSVLSTIELRSCSAETPNANTKGVPIVKNAPAVTINCTRSKSHIS